MSDNLLAVIIGSVVAIVPAVIASWQNRRQAKIIENKLRSERMKLEADYAAQISDSAVDLLKPYREELESLRRRLESLQATVVAYQDESAAMAKKLSKYESAIKSQTAEIIELRGRVDEYENKFIRQSKIINDLELRVSQYREGIVLLVEQIQDAGLRPRYVVPPAITHGDDK